MTFTASKSLAGDQVFLDTSLWKVLDDRYLGGSELSTCNCLLFLTRALEDQLFIFGGPTRPGSSWPSEECTQVGIAGRHVQPRWWSALLIILPIPTKEHPLPLQQRRTSAHFYKTSSCKSDNMSARHHHVENSLLGGAMG